MLSTLIRLWITLAHPAMGNAPPRRRRACRRLFLEFLEDRTVPSIWVEQGPGTIIIDGIANPPLETGAVQALAVDPSNANIIYAGTVNGGVWKTTNATAANPTWAPLTDQQLPALSIDSVAVSPVSPNIVYAGTGSASSFYNDGSPGFGLARSTDGGATWQVLAADTFANQKVRSVVPTSLDGGNVVLVQTYGAGTSLAGYPNGSVYRSSDGGQTFSRISGAPGSGLPDQLASDLVADPSDPSRFYAAVRVQGTATGKEGVYRSDDGGLTWTQVNNGLTGLDTARVIQLAVHNSPGHDVVYAMILSPSADLQGVFRSDDLGSTWTSMGTPSQNIFGQGPLYRRAMVADPTDPNVVLLAGEGISVPNNNLVKTEPGTVVRGDASLKQPWTSVVDDGANGTAPHPDSRALVFDNGNLLDACDGGIYRLADPDTPATRVWTFASGNMDTAEFHSVAYDPVSHVIVGGLQDNGYVVQSAPGSTTWSEFLSGDGGVVAIDSDQAAHPGTSIRYSSIQFFGYAQQQTPGPDKIEYLGSFNRQTFDANNVAGPAVRIALKIVAGDGKGKDLFHFDPNIQFYQPFVLNAVDPRRLLIGTGNLYESFDQGDSLTDLGPAGAIVGSSTAGHLGFNIAMAYGGRLGGVANPDVFYVGAGASILHRVHLGDPITTLSAYPGGNVMNLAVDPQDYRRLYVVDQQGRVWASADEGATWSDLTANLPQLTDDYVGRTIAIFSSPSARDDVLIVGAQGGVFAMVGPGQVGARWAALGDGLPHALVLDLHYDYTDNVLVAGTLGRGAWALSNPFAQELNAPQAAALTGQSGAAAGPAATGSVSGALAAPAAASFDSPRPASPAEDGASLSEALLAAMSATSSAATATAPSGLATMPGASAPAGNAPGSAPSPMPQQQGASASASPALAPSWAGAGADLAFAGGELQAPTAALPGSVGPALPLWTWPALGADVLPRDDRPEALLSSEGAWQGLAVDAYLMDLARTSQTTGSALQGDTAPGPADDWTGDVLTAADPLGDGEAATWPAR
jgi:photosystem II stability/assembly factor-like uncharacterized protein